MVKALKGDPINGYFEHKIAGKLRRFDQSNITEFVDRIPPALFRLIMRHHDEPATIVPIPNSHVIAPNTAGFRTRDLANKIAAESGGRFTVAPALVFHEVQQKSREGGPRNPGHFAEAYRVVRNLRGPIILLDDVCTSGGHLVAAHRVLNRESSPVILATTFGRSTKEQLKEPIGIREEEIDLTKIEQPSCTVSKLPLQWRMPALTRPQKITFAEMRASGVRGLLVYCSDYHCSQWTSISGDRWPDDVRLSDIEPLFTCQACDRKGADVRPNFHWEADARRSKAPAAADHGMPSP
jgi:hypothetical protein